MEDIELKNLTSEIENCFDKVIKDQQKEEYDNILNPLRKILEKVLMQMAKELGISTQKSYPDIKELTDLIPVQLENKGLYMPRNVSLALGTVWIYGSYGTHSQKKEDVISHRSVQISFLAISEFLSWFYEGFLKIPCPDKIKIVASGYKYEEFWEDLLKICEKNSNKHLKIIYGNKYKEELYVNRIALEEMIKIFIERKDSSGFVLIGNSGMGKTNLLCHLFNSWQNQKHATLFINSANIDDLDYDFTKNISKELNTIESFEKTCILINDECERQNKYFIILIDAINEVIKPLELMLKINSFIAHNEHPRIKYIITSRIQVWKQVSNNIQINTSLQSGKYYLDDDKVFKISKFSDDELEKAYNKYKTHYGLHSEYVELSLYIKKLVADPLYLKFVSEDVAKNSIEKKIPKIIDRTELFERIINDNNTGEEDKIKIESIVGDIAELMFSWNKDVLKFEAIKDENKELHKMIINRDRLYQLLVDSEIISEFEMNNTKFLKFTFDRYLEFRMTKLIIRENERIIKDNPESYIEKLVGLYISKIDITINQRFNILWGAIEESLLKLKKGEVERFDNKKEFPGLIQQIAEKANINTIIFLSYFLEKIAVEDTGALEEIIATFEKKAKISENDLRTLIDIVYNILTSDEYYENFHDKPIEKKNVLYRPFILGMQKSGEIGDMSIEYINYLWKYEMHQKNRVRWEFHKTHAENIIELLVNKISFSGIIISKEKRNIFGNLSMLYISVLAENCQYQDDIKKIISFTKQTVGKIPTFIAVKPLSRKIISVMKVLPNVIHYNGLKAICKGSPSHEQFVRIMQYLVAEKISHKDKTDLIDLLKQPIDPITLVFFQHIFSSHYSKSCNTEEERKEYLQFIENTYYENENNSALQFTLFISLYFICYNAPVEGGFALPLIEKMGLHNLKKDEDFFTTLEGKRYPIHSIFCCGKALIKHDTKELAYLKEIINYVREQKNKKYFIQITDEIGDLGTMVSPYKTFDSISDIYNNFIKSTDTGSFEFEIREEVRKSLITGLANMRVRYKELIDDFLKDEIDDRDFTNAVFSTKPTIGFGQHMSQLTSMLFNKAFIFYPKLSEELSDIFTRASGGENPEQAIEYLVRKILNTINRI